MAFTTLAVTGAFLWLASVPYAQESAPANPDNDFVQKASVGGSTEVALSKLALEKGSSDAVKRFAEQMVTDHTMANQELLTLAGRKNIPVPKKVDAKHQAAVDKLGPLQGEEFDRAYGKQMVQDHEETVDLFEKESAQGQDDDLKALATKLLPKLRDHLKMARDLPGAK